MLITAFDYYKTFFSTNKLPEEGSLPGESAKPLDQEAASSTTPVPAGVVNTRTDSWKNRWAFFNKQVQNKVAELRPDDSEKLNVLSLNGGGVRGAVTLEFLRQLEQDGGDVSLHSKFDLFTGTSTGGIIALCCAIGMTPKEILQEYTTLSARVFGDKSWFSLLNPKYDNNILKECIIKVLHKQGYDEQSTLGDLYERTGKHLVIPYVDLEDKGSWKMKYGETFTEEGRAMTLVDVLLFTTAAPSYFSSYKGNVDGAMGLNNPSLAGVMFAKENFPQRDIKLLSLGTGSTTACVEEKTDWGPMQWLAKKVKGGGLPVMLSLFMHMQEQTSAEAARRILGERSFHVIDLPLQQNFALDNYKAIPSLVVKTQDYIKNNAEGLWKKHVSWWQSI